MEIVCLDMEGTLTEEIWEKVAQLTGVEDLGKTTRDIPSYEDLLDMRIKVMSKEGIGLSDIQKLHLLWIFCRAHLNLFPILKKIFKL